MPPERACGRSESWPVSNRDRALHERLQTAERQLSAKKNGFLVTDLPVLININPHPLPSEQLAHVLRPGETYLGTDDEEITEETKDDVRLSDGLNLSNPHCIFEHHANGEVEMIPLNGSLSYVNGQLLTTTFILQHGCRVVLGSNHIFLFVDPLHSKAYREHRKAQGGGIPRIIDWAYASREFADSMNILCKPEQLSALREEVDGLMEEREALRASNEKVYLEFEEYRATPFLILTTEDTETPPEGPLIWRLKAGKNTVGFGGDISPQGAKQLQILDYNIQTGHVTLVMGHRSLSEPLPNGKHIRSGDCDFQLILPSNDAHADMLQQRQKHAAMYMRSGGDPMSPHAGDVLAQPPHPASLMFGPAYDDMVFLDDLRQKLYDLQFTLLAFRDLLFGHPEEENSETMTPEEQDVIEKRKILKDDWVLTSKKVHPRELIDHAGYLLQELRYLAFLSAQREQQAGDAAQTALQQVAAVASELQTAQQALETAREAPKEEILATKAELQQKEKEVFELSKRLLQHSGDQVTIERLKREVNSLNRERAERRPEEERHRWEERNKMEETKRKMRDVQAKLESITMAHDSLVESYNALLKKQTQVRSRVDGGVSSTAAAAADAPVGGGIPLPREAKAFHKMKETIKLLTKVAKSKDDKISRLEKEMQAKDDAMRALNVTLTARDDPRLGDPVNGGSAATTNGSVPGVEQSPHLSVRATSRSSTSIPRVSRHGTGDEKSHGRQSTPVVSPMRTKSTPSPSHERESLYKRSSSASSNRSSGPPSTPSMSNPAGTPTGTPREPNAMSQQPHVRAYGHVSSRVAAYISPKRAGPSPPPPNHSSHIRTTSPRPGPQPYHTVTGSSSLSKIRTLSPRPGPTASTTSRQKKIPSPEPPRRSESPVHTNTPRTQAPAYTPSAASRSSPVKKYRASPSPTVVAVDLVGQPQPHVQSAMMEPMTGGAMPPTSPSEDAATARRPPPAPKAAMGATAAKPPPTEAPSPTSSHVMAQKGTYEIPTTITDLKHQVNRRSPLHP